MFPSICSINNFYAAFVGRQFLFMPLGGFGPEKIQSYPVWLRGGLQLNLPELRAIIGHLSRFSASVLMPIIYPEVIQISTPMKQARCRGSFLPDQNPGQLAGCCRINNTRHSIFSLLIYPVVGDADSSAGGPKKGSARAARRI
jgi:hypothetical protein